MEFARHGNLRDFLRDRRSIGDHRSSSSGGSSAAASTERAAYQPTLTNSDRPQLEKPQLTMKDLVSFAYQSARGMEYLSTRMVHTTLLHRHLSTPIGYLRVVLNFGSGSGKSGHFLEIRPSPAPATFLAGFAGLQSINQSRKP